MLYLPVAYTYSAQVFMYALHVSVPAFSNLYVCIYMCICLPLSRSLSTYCLPLPPTRMQKQPLGNVHHVLKLLAASGHAVPAGITSRARHDASAEAAEKEVFPKSSSCSSSCSTSSSAVCSTSESEQNMAVPHAAPDRSRSRSSGYEGGAGEHPDARRGSETDEQYLVRTCRYCAVVCCAVL
jgi:hypothetical protein